MVRWNNRDVWAVGGVAALATGAYALNQSRSGNASVHITALKDIPAEEMPWLMSVSEISDVYERAESVATRLKAEIKRMFVESFSTDLENAHSRKIWRDQVTTTASFINTINTMLDDSRGIAFLSGVHKEARLSDLTTDDLSDPEAYIKSVCEALQKKYWRLIERQLASEKYASVSEDYLFNELGVNVGGGNIRAMTARMQGACRRDTAQLAITSGSDNDGS